MTRDEILEQYGKPIFEITPETQVRQVWFAGSNQRDLMGMLYKDEKGWVLKYRWRHYAEPVTSWDDTDETAWNGKDTKSVFEIRPSDGDEVDDSYINNMVSKFTEAMESAVNLMQGYDPRAKLWTQTVTKAEEVMRILNTAPWAHSRRIPVGNGDSGNEGRTE